MIDHYPSPNSVRTYTPDEVLNRPRGAAMYRQQTDQTPSIRVRVTRRTLSQARSRTGRTLLARAGEEMSLAEAVGRGIPADRLEAITVQAAAGLRAWQSAQGAPTALESAQVVAAAVATGVEEPSGAGETDAAAGFPHHRGGPYWTLSSGETFKGTREEANAAQAALTGEGEGEPS